MYVLLSMFIMYIVYLCNHFYFYFYLFYYFVKSLVFRKSLPKYNWIQLEFYINNNSECERLGCLSSLPISCRFSRDPNYRCRLTCFLRDSVAFMRDETVPVCTWNRERNLSYASEKHGVLSYMSYVRKNQIGPIDPRRNAITLIYLIPIFAYFSFTFAYLSYLNII